MRRITNTRREAEEEWMSKIGKEGTFEQRRGEDQVEMSRRG
jgi:hypothetical protein